MNSIQAQVMRSCCCCCCYCIHGQLERTQLNWNLIPNVSCADYSGDVGFLIIIAEVLVGQSVIISEFRYGCVLATDAVAAAVIVVVVVGDGGSQSDHQEQKSDSWRQELLYLVLLLLQLKQADQIHFVICSKNGESSYVACYEKKLAGCEELESSD